MSNYPADVINEALMAAGSDFVIGDPTEGTQAAQVTLRKYGQCLRQLLRSVHWDFARQMSPMVLLADATGQTADVGTAVPSPWRFEYAYPISCMKARFVPAIGVNPNSVPAGNIALPDTPQTTVISPAYYGVAGRLMPTPFLISMDTNYPIDTSSNWMESQGVSPQGRVVVLSNTEQAQLVFTAFSPYPTMWDAQFRAAMVAYLAAEIAMPLARDKRFGLQIREQNIVIARQRVMDARVTNGNEGSFPQTTDHTPDFLSIRNAGAGWSAGGPGSDGPWGAGGIGWGGAGYLSYGFDNSVF